MKKQYVILNSFQDLIDCHGNQRFPRNDAPAILSIYSVILSKAKDLINRFFGLRPQNDQPVIGNLFQKSIDCHEAKASRNDVGVVIASIAKQSRAFSLIELLISIIIISLLIAAFTPLITKKMKASDITVGSFGGKNNGDGTTIERNVTRDDCTRLNAVYVSADETGDKPICVMKYNVGDGYYNEDWTDVQKCQASSNCTVENGTSEEATKENLQPTCWQGQTAIAGRCNSNYGGYSGCTRTVCNWTGAEKMCSNLGSGWRLPTIEELESFANTTYSNITLANTGLMFCDNSITTTSASMCNMKVDNDCSGAWSGRCNPHYIWSASLDTESKAHNRNLDGIWYSLTAPLGRAFSARCVLDTVTETIKEVEKEVEVEKPTTPAEAPSPEFCAQFDAMYVPAKWTGSTDLCVTKYNIGDVTSDGSGPTIPKGINTVGTNVSCSSGLCCWKGRTAGSCSEGKNGTDDDVSTYSGCNRTICQFYAANQTCMAWRPKGMQGGYWRLYNTSEISTLAANINILSKNQGKNGLQLCDRSSGYGSDQCRYYNGVCSGASSSSTCYPDHYWGEATAYYNLIDGVVNWGGSTTGTQAFAARCVYDGQRHLSANELETNEDKQKICDKYNAMYLAPKYTGTSDGICVTKYNVGDDGGPTYSNYAALGVTVVGTNVSCSTGYCCWQGKTSGGCTTGANGASTYNGCTRTVCQHNASKALCENWNPDGKGIGKWRLPTTSEISLWAANIDVLSKWQGAEGLQLCDRSSGYGSDQCRYYNGVCSGASSSSTCYPDHYWGEATAYYNLIDGVVNWGGSTTGTQAFAARCVSTEVLK